jgi:hypothetical protein
MRRRLVFLLAALPAVLSAQQPAGHPPLARHPPGPRRRIAPSPS